MCMFLMAVAKDGHAHVKERRQRVRGGKKEVWRKTITLTHPIGY